jgi:hypothetical protein
VFFVDVKLTVFGGEAAEFACEFKPRGPRIEHQGGLERSALARIGPARRAIDPRGQGGCSRAGISGETVMHEAWLLNAG